MVALQALEPLIGAIPAEKLASTGLVLGTTLGCLEMDREFDRSRREDNGRYASPAAFSRTLPSTIAAELALQFQLTGPSLVLSSGNDSASTAIQRARAWMHHFELDYCIAGGLEFAGPNTGVPEGQLVVLMLLARESAKAIASITIDPFQAPKLTSVCDDSLIQLAHWIENPVRATIQQLRIEPC
jgi:hypothetical protein